MDFATRFTHQIRTDMLENLAEKIAQEPNGRLYYVGGYVRDEFLHIPNMDIDVEAHGVTLERLKQIILDYGYAVSEVGKSFGILRIEAEDIDIALPRTEIKTGDKHTDFDVAIDPNLGTFAACKRRDFTINAMMKDILTGEIIDHFGGQADIKNKVLRHVDDTTFIEDPLRVLRGCGFASRFDFTIHPDTVTLAKTMDISTLPCERVFKEVTKVLLQSNNPMTFFEQLNVCDHLDVWFPEVKLLYDIKQSPIWHPEGDVFNHTKLVLEAASNILHKPTHGCKVQNDLAFMLAALCHDFGKIDNTTIEIVDNREVIRSIGHEKDTTRIKTFLTRLTNETKLIELVLNLCELHMKPIRRITPGEEVDYRNKTFMKLWDKAICPNDLILLSQSDVASRLTTKERFDILCLNLWSLKEYEYLMQCPQVQGKDLIALGLKPSPIFSQMLEFAHRLHLARVPKKDVLRQIVGKYRREFDHKFTIEFI